MQHFLPPEKGDAKDVLALYERLFPALDLSNIFRTFVYCFAVGERKQSTLDAETRNIVSFSFIIIYPVRRSQPSLSMPLFLTTVM